jgi:uncharacterized surface protein with fasciclin (FAS1) repeats
MNKLLPTVLVLALLPAFVIAQDAPVTEPAPTPPAVDTPDRSRTLVENLARYDDNARLSRAIAASGLADALGALGPLTVFAPTDSAFSSSLYADYDDLLKPENRGMLAELLRYHIVSGLLDTATLTAKIEAGGGATKLQTIQGGTLVVTRSGNDFLVTDATNHTAHITRTDLYQRNGIVQVVDQVLMPNVR